MDNKDTSGKNLTGGYLLEVDTRLDEDFYFWTKRVPFTIQSPDDILPVQLSYINSYAQQAEDALFSDSFADPVTGYEKYIDSDSFIKWYLVNELFKNNDADFNSSVYMYKDRNGKLAMGPVWDFDIAAGEYQLQRQ
ncbi:MAG: CotH kinase family protein [Bacteroidota bacterium]